MVSKQKVLVVTSTYLFAYAPLFGVYKGNDVILIATCNRLAIWAPSYVNVFSFCLQDFNGLVP